QAQAEIKQRSITISNLNNQIGEKSSVITTLQTHLDKGHASLAKIIRIQNEFDTMSLAELVLTSQDFSDLYGDIDQLATVSGQLQDTFDQVQKTKAQTEAEKQALTETQNKQLDAQHEVEVTKAQITKNQQEKKQLLNITTSNEAAYQKVLADRQQKAEQIRTA